MIASVKNQGFKYTRQLPQAALLCLITLLSACTYGTPPHADTLLKPSALIFLNEYKRRCIANLKVLAEISFFHFCKTICEEGAVGSTEPQLQ